MFQFTLNLLSFKNVADRGVHRPCRDAGASSWRGLVRRAPEEVQGRQDRQTGSEYQGQAGHGGAGDRF